MAKENSKKNKHLMPEDRKEIEECLSKRMTFKAIGKLISKEPTTVSYEIKHHRSEHRNSFVTEDSACPELLRSPFVCNGCPKKRSDLFSFLYDERFASLMGNCRIPPEQVVQPSVLLSGIADLSKNLYRCFPNLNSYCFEFTLKHLSFQCAKHASFYILYMLFVVFSSSLSCILN